MLLVSPANGCSPLWEGGGSENEAIAALEFYLSFWF